MQLLATLISATRQSQLQQTHNSPSVISGRTPVTFEWIQHQTVVNKEKMKQKTLQLCPMNPPPPTPQKTIPQQPRKQATPETQKKLQQWKETLRKKMTTTANDTGAPSTTLTRVQELCLKQFKAHHAMWARREKKTTDLVMAKHYRLTSMAMALYLFVIHPELYKRATSALRAAGKQYPNPLTTVHTCMALNPKFIQIL